MQLLDEKDFSILESPTPTPTITTTPTPTPTVTRTQTPTPSAFTGKYFRSCCDPNITFTIVNFMSLPIGNYFYVQIPNSFSGCAEIIEKFELLPNSAIYSSSQATLTMYSDCSNCNQQYPCIRITAKSECDIATIIPMTIDCVPNTINSTITINVQGGTPPYKISWSNGFLGQTIQAQEGVNYTVTVTDYDWPNVGPDFTATTICSLPKRTPTPTPTMTVTPSREPINSQILCLTYREGVSTIGGGSTNLTTTQITLFPTQNKVNGKFTWSSDTFTLEWSLDPLGWIINYETFASSFIFNPSSSPIGTYTVIGYPAEFIITDGTCVTPNMVLLSPTISAPICNSISQQSTGSIIINIQDQTPPVLYSINNGNTTQSTNIFNNLPAGVYSIWVQDSKPTTLTSTVVIPVAPTQTTYTLNILSNITQISAAPNSEVQRLDFTIQVLNSQSQPVTTLPVGTQITFNLAHVNDFKVTNSPTKGSRIITTSILKNGSPLTLINTVSTFTPSPIPALVCSPGTLEYSTATTTNYQNITISGSDVITGSIIVQVNRQMHPGIPCYVVSLDKVQIVNSSKTGCSCCDVTGLPQSTQMITTFNSQVFNP
jgi:hypothetical protein